LTAVAVILLAGLAPEAAEGQEPQALGFAEAFRQALMRSIDAGTVGGIFIVSDELTGLLLTQVSENGGLLEVFQDLFRSEGSEVYLKPAKD
jgi:hypothetical protein